MKKKNVNEICVPKVSNCLPILNEKPNRDIAPRTIVVKFRILENKVVLRCIEYIRQVYFAVDRYNLAAIYGKIKRNYVFLFFPIFFSSKVFKYLQTLEKINHHLDGKVK